ncbi:glutamate dehydrogenase [Bizionia gelidisalsuginis]|uniref:Glutamate dehydrogenase n=2 Tax=Bizionia TaxID=283785 RepID=A0A8H2QEQ7_9FLAO|nr:MULTISPECIES: glutamate dehydrogenase [Bizionia]TYB75972.1 glutamate dehydrogenase [Bizionia saleffrena]TYC13475.1 glutamate dehydrogenase [Bizionia gelidisalsuginis]
MLTAKQLSLLFFIFFISKSAFSQLGFSHEIGIIAGPVAFKSDYGLRTNLTTNAGNTGVGIGIVHFLDLAYRSNRYSYSIDNFIYDHFKLRTEISYNKTKLEHFGKYVDPSRTSDEAQRLRDHTGEANNLDVGMQIEFYPFSIRDFQNFSSRWAPFISAGAHFVAFNPKVSTAYLGEGDPGNIKNLNNFYTPWSSPYLPDPIDASPGTTWSVVSSVGVRYKLNVMSDLMLDLRGQYYFNDWIDGLNHGLPDNKYNDWMVWLNFGYIYYLE